MPEPRGSYADRAGELWGERRHARDERHPDAGKTWDHEPMQHLCAPVPDLVALDEPPARLGPLTGLKDRKQEIPSRGCPRGELATNWARFSEREPVVLKGRRGERESF